MSVSDTTFFGGAIFQNISATLNLHPYKRVWTITATASQIVKLPDATTLRTGGPYFYVINIGSNSFDLQDNGSTVLDTVAVNEVVLCALANNSTAAGQWFNLRRALS